MELPVDTCQVEAHDAHVTTTNASIQRRAALRLKAGLIDQAEHDRQCGVEPVAYEPTRDEFLAMMRGSGACVDFDAMRPGR